MNVDEYRLWMPRWRSISNMTLKSQLVRSQLSSDVDKWSSGFKLVEEDALYIMSEQLQSRVHSTDLEFYLSSFERNIIYLSPSPFQLLQISL